MSFNVGVATYHFNVDISSCDMSNGPSIFKLLELLVEGDGMATGVVKRLVEQCKHNLRCYNPYDKSEYYEFKSDGPKEYSGTVITTLLNNIASSMISTQVEKLFTASPNDTPDGLRQMIESAAFKCGYIVTVSERSDYAHLQFLKNSPTKHGQSYVDLGVLLRGLGGINGDFPGSGDLSVRIETFVSSVVEGYKHAGNSSVTRALNVRFPPQGKKVKLSLSSLNTYVIAQSGEASEVTDEDLILRYLITQSELDELVDSILHMQIGDIVNIPATNNIFHTDYEYPLQNFSL